MKIFSVYRAEPKLSPVTYIPVAENKHISMGIFVIREGQNIPLHDHPHMHGVIKCLEGKLKITSFTKVVCSCPVSCSIVRLSHSRKTVQLQTGFEGLQTC